MSTAPRRAGAYSPSQGMVLRTKPFRRKPPVPCPPVGDLARQWWETWAASPYAWEFMAVEWLDLADTALLMDRFYESGEPRYLAEARQHMNNLFGLATRARLHVSVEPKAAAPAVPVSRRDRPDPRLKAV